MKLLSPTSPPSIPSSSQPLDILFEKPDQVSLKLARHYQDPLPPWPPHPHGLGRPRTQEHALPFHTCSHSPQRMPPPDIPFFSSLTNSASSFKSSIRNPDSEASPLPHPRAQLSVPPQGSACVCPWTFNSVCLGIIHSEEEPNRLDTGTRFVWAKRSKGLSGEFPCFTPQFSKLPWNDIFVFTPKTESSSKQGLSFFSGPWEPSRVPALGLVLNKSVFWSRIQNIFWPHFSWKQLLHIQNHKAGWAAFSWDCKEATREMTASKVSGGSLEAASRLNPREAREAELPGWLLPG